MKVDSEAALSLSTESVKTGDELPELVLKKFSGDPLEWNQFRETYEAAIHQNTRISNVQKFSDLINYLDGSAKQAVASFRVTNEGYEEAFTLLKNRYGNPQLIISSHMNQLIKLDRVKGNVRALNTIGINSDQYGPLLIPIVLEKLPNVIRLQISRKLGKNDWNIGEFLVAINAEITARKNYEFLKHDENNDGNKFNSQHALTSGINRKSVVFVKVKHTTVIDGMLLLMFKPDEISLKRNVTALIGSNKVIPRRIAVQKLNAININH